MKKSKLHNLLLTVLSMIVLTSSCSDSGCYRADDDVTTTYAIRRFIYPINENKADTSLGFAAEPIPGFTEQEYRYPWQSLQYNIDSPRSQKSQPSSAKGDLMVYYGKQVSLTVRGAVNLSGYIISTTVPLKISELRYGDQGVQKTAYFSEMVPLPVFTPNNSQMLMTVISAPSTVPKIRGVELNNGLGMFVTIAPTESQTAGRYGDHSKWLCHTGKPMKNGCGSELGASSGALCDNVSGCADSIIYEKCDIAQKNVWCSGYKMPTELVDASQKNDYGNSYENAISRLNDRETTKWLSFVRKTDVRKQVANAYGWSNGNYYGVNVNSGTGDKKWRGSLALTFLGSCSTLYTIPWSNLSSFAYCTANYSQAHWATNMRDIGGNDPQKAQMQNVGPLTYWYFTPNDGTETCESIDKRYNIKSTSELYGGFYQYVLSNSEVFWGLKTDNPRIECDNWNVSNPENIVQCSEVNGTNRANVNPTICRNNGPFTMRWPLQIVLANIPLSTVTNLRMPPQSAVNSDPDSWISWNGSHNKVTVPEQGPCSLTMSVRGSVNGIFTTQITKDDIESTFWPSFNALLKSDDIISFNVPNENSNYYYQGHFPRYGQLQFNVYPAARDIFPAHAGLKMCTTGLAFAIKPITFVSCFSGYQNGCVNTRVPIEMCIGSMQVGTGSNIDNVSLGNCSIVSKTGSASIIKPMRYNSSAVQMINTLVPAGAVFSDAENIRADQCGACIKRGLEVDLNTGMPIVKTAEDFAPFSKTMITNSNCAANTEYTWVTSYFDKITENKPISFIFSKNDKRSFCLDDQYSRRVSADGNIFSLTNYTIADTSTGKDDSIKYGGLFSNMGDSPTATINTPAGNQFYTTSIGYAGSGEVMDQMFTKQDMIDNILYNKGDSVPPDGCICSSSTSCVSIQTVSSGAVDPCKNLVPSQAPDNIYRANMLTTTSGIQAKNGQNVYVYIQEFTRDLQGKYTTTLDPEKHPAKVFGEYATHDSIWEKYSKKTIPSLMSFQDLDQSDGFTDGMAVWMSSFSGKLWLAILDTNPPAGNNPNNWRSDGRIITFTDDTPKSPDPIVGSGLVNVLYYNTGAYQIAAKAQGEGRKGTDGFISNVISNLLVDFIQTFFFGQGVDDKSDCKTYITLDKSENISNKSDIESQIPTTELPPYEPPPLEDKALGIVCKTDGTYQETAEVSYNEDVPRCVHCGRLGILQPSGYYRPMTNSYLGDAVDGVTSCVHVSNNNMFKCDEDVFSVCASNGNPPGKYKNMNIVNDIITVCQKQVNQNISNGLLQYYECSNAIAPRAGVPATSGIPGFPEITAKPGRVTKKCYFDTNIDTTIPYTSFQTTDAYGIKIFPNIPPDTQDDGRVIEILNLSMTATGQREQWCTGASGSGKITPENLSSFCPTRCQKPGGKVNRVTILFDGCSDCAFDLRTDSGSALEYPQFGVAASAGGYLVYKAEDIPTCGSSRIKLNGTFRTWVFRTPSDPCPPGTTTGAIVTDAVTSDRAFQLSWQVTEKQGWTGAKNALIKSSEVVNMQPAVKQCTNVHYIANDNGSVIYPTLPSSGQKWFCNSGATRDTANGHPCTSVPSGTRPLLLTSNSGAAQAGRVVEFHNWQYTSTTIEPNGKTWCYLDSMTDYFNISEEMIKECGAKCFASGFNADMFVDIVPSDFSFKMFNNNGYRILQGSSSMQIAYYVPDHTRSTCQPVRGSSRYELPILATMLEHNFVKPSQSCPPAPSGGKRIERILYNPKESCQEDRPECPSPVIRDIYHGLNGEGVQWPNRSIAIRVFESAIEMTNLVNQPAIPEVKPTPPIFPSAGSPAMCKLMLLNPDRTSTSIGVSKEMKVQRYGGCVESCMDTTILNIDTCKANNRIKKCNIYNFDSTDHNKDIATCIKEPFTNSECWTLSLEASAAFGFPYDHIKDNDILENSILPPCDINNILPYKAFSNCRIVTENIHGLENKLEYKECTITRQCVPQGGSVLETVLQKQKVPKTIQEGEGLSGSGGYNGINGDGNIALGITNCNPVYSDSVTYGECSDNLSNKCKTIKTFDCAVCNRPTISGLELSTSSMPTQINYACQAADNKRFYCTEQLFNACKGIPDANVQLSGSDTVTICNPSIILSTKEEIMDTTKYYKSGYQASESMTVSQYKCDITKKCTYIAPVSNIPEVRSLSGSSTTISGVIPGPKYKTINVCSRSRKWEEGVVYIVNNAMASSLDMQILAGMVIIIMIIMKGYGIIIGKVKVNVSSLLKEAINIGVVSAVCLPGTFAFYQKYVISSFLAINDGFNTMVVKALYPSSIGMQNAFGPIDIFFTDFIINEVTWYKMLAALFDSFTGLLCVIAAIYAIINYLLGFAKAVVMYVSCLLMSYIYLMFGVVFAFCYLYDRTRSYAMNWINGLAGFLASMCYQFAIFALFTELMIGALEAMFSFTICFTSIIEIPIVNVTLLGWWTIPGRMPSQLKAYFAEANVQLEGGKLDSYPSINNIIILIMIVATMEKFSSEPLFGGRAGLDSFFKDITDGIKKAQNAVQGAAKAALSAPFKAAGSGVEKGMEKAASRKGNAGSASGGASKPGGSKLSALKELKSKTTGALKKGLSARAGTPREKASKSTVDVKSSGKTSAATVIGTAATQAMAESGEQKQAGTGKTSAATVIGTAATQAMAESGEQKQAGTGITMGSDAVGFGNQGGEVESKDNMMSGFRRMMSQTKQQQDTPGEDDYGDDDNSTISLDQIRQRRRTRQATNSRRIELEDIQASDLEEESKDKEAEDKIEEARD